MDTVRKGRGWGDRLCPVLLVGGGAWPGAESARLPLLASGQDSCPRQLPKQPASPRRGQEEARMNCPGSQGPESRAGTSSHTQCRREHTCTHTYTGAHPPELTYGAAQSTSDQGPTTPTWRPFSFCSWKASTISSSWWEVRLASTQALCTPVSAWRQRYKVSWGLHSGSFSVPSPHPWASCPASWESLANWFWKEWPSGTTAKGAAASWTDPLVSCVTSGKSLNPSEPQCACLQTGDGCKACLQDCCKHESGLS